MGLAVLSMLGILGFLALYVSLLVSIDRPQNRPGPAPMRRVKCDISPATWNPPGSSAWEFLGSMNGDVEDV